MKTPWGKRRRFDKGAASVAKPFRRALHFEQMEERLTLSTTTVGPTPVFENISQLEGGLISLDYGQVFAQDAGVIDSAGLHGFEFSNTSHSDHIQNYQGDLDATSNLHVETTTSATSRGDSSSEALGRGLETVAKIDPPAIGPPTQVEGGKVQIAMLFDPAFEKHVVRETNEILAKTPDAEAYQEETWDLASRQELAPAQGREMAFEVASTYLSVANNREHNSEFNESQRNEVDASENFPPARKSANSVQPRAAVNVPVTRPADHLPAHDELASAAGVSQSAATGITQVEHREIKPGKVVLEARDQVFAEWEERSTKDKTPTAPLAKDRERQVTPTILLSGVAILSAGIHYARSHSRNSLKETKQYVRWQE